MRKLIGGKYVPVEVLTQEADADQANDDGLDLIEGADIEEMDKDQLVSYLRDSGKVAFANWKIETLRTKALALVKG